MKNTIKDFTHEDGNSYRVTVTPTDDVEEAKATLQLLQLGRPAHVASGTWDGYVFDTEDKVDPYLLSETLVILSLMDEK